MRILFIIPDNESYINSPPHGVAYLTAYLKRAGQEVVIYNQDVYHWPEEHLTKYLDSNYFDFVGVGFIGNYYQHKKVVKIAEAINRSKNRPIFVLGGHGPAPEPEYFLRLTKADVVVIGEGEQTLLELLTNTHWNEIKGLAYLKNGKLVRTEKRELIKDLDSLPFPAWEEFPIDHYALMREAGCSSNDRMIQIVTSRGCPYHCNFCFRLDEGYRKRSIKSVVEEIIWLKEKFSITALRFGDELLMPSIGRATELCDALLSKDINIKWMCCGRLNFADKEVLKLMKRAGCFLIVYGVESLDDEILKVMNKKLTVKQIIEGTENTIDAGILPYLSIIFGNIGETAEILQRGVDFLKKYNPYNQMRTISPVTPYPGSPLYYYAIEKGLIKGVEDFYSKHLNSDLLTVNFTNLTDEDFYRSLKKANHSLIEDYYAKNLKASLDKVESLYENKDPNFRGYRQT
jgi:radical SAM superfamily enzyme YgiQ (UPF0313 family)